MTEVREKHGAPIEVRVLIVDGEARTKVVVSSALKTAGHSIIVADNWPHAMDLFDRNITVAFLDMSLAKTDSLQCLRFVRQNFPDTQIIMVSDSPDVPPAVNAMKEGACNYLTTPLNQAEIIAAVDDAVQIHHEAKEHHALPKTATYTHSRVAIDHL